VSAQDQDQQAPPPAQQPAAPAKPAEPEKPKRPAWHGSFSAGLAFAGGVQQQKGYQLNAGVKRPFSDGGSFVANASRQYQKVKFPSESLLNDRTSFAFGVDENFTKYTTAMVRSLYLHDQLLYVDSRYEELFGYGLHLYDKDKRYELHLIPGIEVFKENLVYSADKDWRTGGGFFEKLTAKINKAWSAENAFRYRHNFGNSNQSIESTASLQGAITKTLGLQVEYQYNYESIVPPHFPNYLQILSLGLRFQF